MDERTYNPSAQPKVKSLPGASNGMIVGYDTVAEGK
jgi:hypothetical protein